MRLIAEGCEHCEPQLALQGEREGEHHYSVRFNDFELEVFTDGESALDCTEVWAGAPGRVIRVAASGPARLCLCQEYDHRGWFAQLIEYGCVEVRLVAKQEVPHGTT